MNVIVFDYLLLILFSRRIDLDSYKFLIVSKMIVYLRILIFILIFVFFFTLIFILMLSRVPQRATWFLFMMYLHLMKSVIRFHNWLFFKENKLLNIRIYHNQIFVFILKSLQYVFLCNCPLLHERQNCTLSMNYFVSWDIQQLVFFLFLLVWLILLTLMNLCLLILIVILSMCVLFTMNLMVMHVIICFKAITSCFTLRLVRLILLFLLLKRFQVFLFGWIFIFPFILFLNDCFSFCGSS